MSLSPHVLGALVLAFVQNSVAISPFLLLGRVSLLLYLLSYSMYTLWLSQLARLFPQLLLDLFSRLGLCL